MSEICGERYFSCTCTNPKPCDGTHACTNDGCQGVWMIDRQGEPIALREPFGMTISGFMEGWDL